MSIFSRRNFLKTSAVAAAGFALSGVSVQEALAQSQTVQGKAGIVGIHHTGIYVENIEKAVKYYEDFFGFKLITISDTWEGPDKPLRLGFMRLGDAYIELLEPGDKEKINVTSMNTLNHIGLRSTNIEQTYKYLKDKGANMETPIIDTSAPFDRKVTDKGLFTKYGDKGATIKIFFLRGINGERIEIMQDNLGNIQG